MASKKKKVIHLHFIKDTLLSKVTYKWEIQQKNKYFQPFFWNEIKCKKIHANL